MDSREARREEMLTLYVEAIGKLAAAHGEIAERLGETSEIGAISAAAVFEAERITERAKLIAEGRAS